MGQGVALGPLFCTKRARELEVSARWDVLPGSARPGAGWPPSCCSSSGLVLHYWPKTPGKEVHAHSYFQQTMHLESPDEDHFPCSSGCWRSQLCRSSVNLSSFQPSSTMQVFGCFPCKSSFWWGIYLKNTFISSCFGVLVSQLCQHDLFCAVSDIPVDALSEHKLQFLELEVLSLVSKSKSSFSVSECLSCTAVRTLLIHMLWLTCFYVVVTFIISFFTNLKKSTVKRE